MTASNEPGLLRAIDLAKELDADGHIFGSRNGVVYMYRKNLPGLVKRLEDELRALRDPQNGGAT